MSAAVAVKERPAPEVAEGMRLAVNRGELLRALGRASAIVERRNTIPVLSNVLLEAAGGKLRIVATDLNLQIALTVPCEVKAEGATTVSAALILGIVRELPEGEVELKLDAARLQVNSGRSRYKLQTIPCDQFPSLADEGGAGSFTLAASDLTRSLARVAFAQDTDTVVRPHYCGVNVETADDKLTFVATDGKRIAWSMLPAPKDVALESAILPAKLVSTLTKLLADHEGDVALAFAERKVKAEFGNTTLHGKLIDGTYPPWRRIIPQGEGKRLLIAADALEAAVRRTSAVALERTRAVKIELATDKITVSVVTSNQETAIEEAPCVWDSGDYVLGFNSRFLLDALAACAAGELQIDFHEGASPLALFINPDDDSARWLLAPMYV